MTPGSNRPVRYDFAPVDAHRRIDLSELARRVGVTVRRVHRWRSAGLSEDHADRCAGAMGMTPHELWPEWTDHAVAEVSRLCATCGDSFVLTRSDKRYCSRPCRERSPERMAKKRPQAAAYARDRYWSDPVYREAQREKRRA